MEKLNQLFFIVFALILLGIYLSTVKASSSERDRYVNWYWSSSILFRASAFFVWAIVPIVGNGILVFANVFFMASLMGLLFTFRSWRTVVSRNSVFYAFIFLIFYAIAFELIIHYSENFLYRMVLFSGCVIIISIFELIELIKNARSDNSVLLKLIILLAFIQLSMSGVTIGLITNSLNSQVTNILQNSEGGSVGFWLTFGMHLIIYVLVNSFLYQKLWDSEKKAHDQLKESRLRLTSVTKEKEEVAELLKERDALVNQLLRANKTVATGALSASIAHEINQPLTVIQINVQLLRELMSVQNKHADPKMQLELVEEILKNNQRASNIVKSLRSIFSEQSQDFERVDVVQIIQSVLDISKAELNSKKITVALKLPDSAFANVYPQEVLQIILNLFNNAIASLAASSQTNKNIVVELTNAGEQIQISIADNGPGVPEANESQLFELLADAKRTGMGLGLGLWLCKYVIGRHNGVIWHERVVGGGAKFCVQFPANLISYKIKK